MSSNYPTNALTRAAPATHIKSEAKAARDTDDDEVKTHGYRCTAYGRTLCVYPTIMSVRLYIVA
jgi:hypothetical protein